MERLVERGLRLFKRRKKKGYILLVDNFDQIREVTHSILEGGGYQVTALGNAVEALKMIDKKKPDLIISEVELAGIGGIGFYHRLKKQKQTRNIPFIFMTGYNRVKIKRELKHGDILIPKPVRSNEVLLQIERFLLQKKGIRDEKSALQKTKRLHVHKDSSSNKTAKIPSSRDTLQKTVYRAKPKTLTIPISQKNKAEKKQKKKKMPLISLPPGRSTTHHFTDPVSRFTLKEIRASYKKVMNAFKSGKQPEVVPYTFENLEFAWENLPPIQIPDAVKINRDIDEEILLDMEIDELLAEDEEVLIDLEMETANEEFEEQIDAEFISEDDQILDSLETDEETVVDEDVPTISPQIAHIHELVPEYHFPEKIPYLWLNRNSGSMDTSLGIKVSADQVTEFSHNIFSMAGLCFQMLGQDIDVAYVDIETEQDHIILVNDVETSSYGIVCAFPKASPSDGVDNRSSV